MGYPLVQSPLKIAHKIEISGTVGGTMHIEPNDTPKAGESNLVWFALTRQGGDLIPLTVCDCSLSLYSQPRTEDSVPIQQPLLQSVDAEGYQGIPGAEISFPEVGAYELVVEGKPNTSGDFQPFELTFSVTVAIASQNFNENETSQPEIANESVVPLQSPDSQNPLPEPNSDPFNLGIGLLLGLSAIVIGIIWFRRNQ